MAGIHIGISFFAVLIAVAVVVVSSVVVGVRRMAKGTGASLGILAFLRRHCLPFIRITYTPTSTSTTRNSTTTSTAGGSGKVFFGRWVG